MGMVDDREAGVEGRGATDSEETVSAEAAVVADAWASMAKYWGGR